MAGLGNQMFQYATARSLSMQRNSELYLDTSSYSNIAEGDTVRKFELDIYNIKASIASNELLSSVLPEETVRPRYTERLRELFGGGRVWTYTEKHHGFNKNIQHTPKNVYISGWWQSPMYFESIRPILLEDFEPVASLNGANAEYIAKAQADNSISLHVRRGDYVSNSNAASHHGLAPIDYYTKAIEYFKNETASPTFFVFSDDLEWCKANLPLDERAVFVSGNEGDSAYEDIRIMKNCKHAVIANSSFSWWGAWLNDNPNKIVIAPKVWLQDEEANKKIDIIPEGWLRF